MQHFKCVSEMLQLAPRHISFRLLFDDSSLKLPLVMFSGLDSVVLSSSSSLFIPGCHVATDGPVAHCTRIIIQMQCKKRNN